jgi:predicted nucleic acid-binding protein
MKYFLDTNVFMYAAGRDHALKAPCVAVLRRVAREELEVLTNAEVLQEILYRYGAIGELQRGLHLARLAVDQVGGEVLPVTLADMRRAFDLVGRYGTAITCRDAVHAATMLSNGLTHLISADSHFDVIEGIARLDPQKAARLKA